MIFSLSVRAHNLRTSFAPYARQWRQTTRRNNDTFIAPEPKDEGNGRNAGAHGGV